MNEPLYINGEINPKLQVRTQDGTVKKVPAETMKLADKMKREKKESRDEVYEDNTPFGRIYGQF